MTKSIEAKRLTLKSLKGSDVLQNVSIDLGEEGFLRFDQYYNPSYVLPVDGEPAYPTPVVNFRAWRDDPVYASVTIDVDPEDPRKAKFLLLASQSSNIRTSRVFFECIGKRKADNVQEVLFFGTLDFVR